MENEDTPHELMDIFAVIWGAGDLETAMHSAARKIGLTSALLPDTHQLVLTPIPESAVAKTWPTIAKYYGGRPDTIEMIVDLWPSHLSDLYLAELDRRGMLSPVLWVHRSGLEDVQLPKDTEFLPEQGIGIFNRDAFFESGPEEGAVLALGNELSSNRWWRQDISKAIFMLSKLSKEHLEAELDAGEMMVRGDPAAVHFWQPQWVIRPVIIGSNQEAPGEFPFPEYPAIPFYRAGDDKRAFEMVMDSYLHIPLLTEITDSWAARAKVIDQARQRKELPPTETRGRPQGRPRYLVREVAKMHYEKHLPKRQIAKRLDMPRSTVYDYLREHEKKREDEPPPVDE